MPLENQIAYIGLGSNLEQPLDQLQKAIGALEKIPASELKKVSSFYLTKPVGPQDQPDYINAVAKLATRLQPLDLLDELQAIENSQGRIRNGEHWGPRTLDLDVLLYANEVLDLERLKVPHPEIANRAFVLQPLAELEPKLNIPLLGKIDALLAMVDTTGIKKITSDE